MPDGSLRVPDGIVVTWQTAAHACSPVSPYGPDITPRYRLTQQVGQIYPVLGIFVLQDPFVAKYVFDLGRQFQSLAIGQGRLVGDQDLRSNRREQLRI